VQTIREIAALREAIGAFRAAGERVALVPTMGALHAGHMALIEEAKRVGTRIVASIFVNPKQFGPNEDLDQYPRREGADARMLADAGCDVLWMPTAETMYPAGFATNVSVAGVSEVLDGAARPGHFDGVATVVCKLFNQVRPDMAFFGEKDWQQLAVIRRMVEDLDIPVEILGGPILREADGLAMSSRNVYLSDSERKAAGQLNVILRETAAKVAAGAIIPEATRGGADRIRALGFDHVDYLEIRDAATLEIFPSGRPTSPARILVAAKIGRTRLIDNMPV
jgi:pantoate--beta-alanine ligase